MRGGPHFYRVGIGQICVRGEPHFYRVETGANWCEGRAPFLQGRNRGEFV